MKKTYPIDDLGILKKKVQKWLRSFSTCCYLDNNQYPHYTYSRYEWIAAAGADRLIRCQYGQALKQLQQFMQYPNQWYFGYFGYDLKNEIEKLHTRHPNLLELPDLFFFVPQHIVYLPTGNRMLTIESPVPDKIYEEICQADIDAGRDTSADINSNVLYIRPSFTYDDYFKTIEVIKEQIATGHFYEINICIEFLAQHRLTDAWSVFQRLNGLNQAPFSAYLQHDFIYILCTSPERFLMKKGDQLIAQPMKGTIRKGTTEEENQQLMEQLRHSIKEQSENVMIVDLVRNDLARSCRPGSVRVEELFGIYPFAQVNQMVSVVSGRLLNHVTPIQAICSAFPMGSMTGAPKIVTMQYIDNYEHSRRGVYSGALGYFSPNGDFDFNVVIRSILYNEERKIISFHTGSAITYDSDPAKEYEECMIKAKAMKQALSADYAVQGHPR